MKTAAWLASLLVLMVVSGCQSVGPAPATPQRAASRPVAPTLDVAGELSTVHDAGATVTYFLKDGRTWSRPSAQFRVAYDMSSDRTLIVAGEDAQGSFVALIGSQPGLPADCVFALRYDGVDWGDSIESQGILWRKTPAFATLSGPIAPGTSYPDSTIFCMSGTGEAMWAIQIHPPGTGSAPVQSAAAP